MKVIVLLAIVAMSLLSCEFPVTTSNTTKNTTYLTSQKFNSSIDLATAYTSNVVAAFNYFCVNSQSGRVLTSESALDGIRYFDNLVIRTDDGRKVLLSQLSKEDRDTFLSGWQNETSKILAENIEASQDATDYLMDLNDALVEAIETTKVVRGNYHQFSDKYNELLIAKTNLRIASRKTTVRSLGPTGSGRGDDVIYWEGYYKLKNAYKQGYIIASDTQGDSPFGHASMFTEPAWRSPQWDVPRSTWDVNHDARISITASLSDGTKSYYDVDGNSAPAVTENLAEWGVSYERLFVWVTQANWIKHVKVLEPGYREWNIAGILGPWHPATDADRAKAVENAKKNLGKPYSSILEMADLNSTDKFYCSKIVWRAWYDVDPKYDFHNFGVIGIPPTELMKSVNLNPTATAEWNMDEQINYSFFDADFDGDNVLDHFRYTPSGYASAGLIEVSLVKKGSGGQWRALFGQDNSKWTAKIQSYIQPYNLWNAVFATSEANGLYKQYFADVNGDRSADLIQFSTGANGGWISYAKPDGTFHIWDATVATSEANGLYKQYFADVNGDKRADLIQFSTGSSGGWISYAKPDGTFHIWDATIATSEANGLYRQYFADVNGDERADLIQFSTGSNGGWISYAKIDGTFHIWDATIATSEANGLYRQYFADVNGDKRADLIQFSTGSNGGWISYAKPDGTFHIWDATIATSEANGHYKQYFADINGDERADLVQVSTAGDGGWIAYAKPDGTFHLWDAKFATSQANGRYKQFFADVNGDKRADLLQVSTAADGGWTSFARPFDSAIFLHY